MWFLFADIEVTDGWSLAGYVAAAVIGLVTVYVKLKNAQLESIIKSREDASNKLYSQLKHNAKELKAEKNRALQLIEQQSVEIMDLRLENQRLRQKLGEPEDEQ